MKSKFFTLIASAAMLSAAHAFTIDFNSLQVSGNTGVIALDFDNAGDQAVNDGASVTVNVPGYGGVRFEVAPGGSDVGIGNQYSNDGGTTFQSSLEVEPGETIQVTFLGDNLININFDLIGVSAGEDTDVTPIGITGKVFQYKTLAGGSPANDGAGISGISWTTVPEPSSSLMVLLGAGSLILRRRR